MKSIIRKIEMTCKTLQKYSNVFAGNIDQIVYQACGYKENDIPPESGWMPFLPGTGVAGKDNHYWFKLNFHTPKAQAHRHIVLSSATGYEGEQNTILPQSMVFVDGKLIQALDTNHTQVRLEADRDYEIYIYFYLASVEVSCEFKLWLAWIDEPSEQLFYDLFVPFRACKDVYIENSYEYANTVKYLDQTCNLVNLNDPYTKEYYEQIEIARQFLKENYYESFCGDSPVVVDCIGHTHIDVAWLWTLAQTREKVQRSFATVRELMRYYPEYQFMMSQPQLFRFMSEVDPQLYADIKDLVHQGRFELEGAMWLEADCNLTSGESLVRQILHGKRFLKQEFNIDSKVLWLPDVFGYSAALPQILKKSGITHFVTSKISWNDTNTMPYDTFMWQGIDGTEIMTDFITAQKYLRGGHFTNETTYAGKIMPSMVAGTWNRYQQKEYNDHTMLVYGWGDGGGGPTADMLEQQRRLSYGLPGIPRTQMSTLKDHLKTVEENFHRACAETGRVPRWVGELYLEFHRGTYTSMAKNKRYNRKSEMLMQRLEGLASVCSSLTEYEYPKQEFYSMWDTILLNQFHDIIPGSSIRQVYDVSWQQYEELHRKGAKLFEDAFAVLAQQVRSDQSILVYNALGFDRSDYIEMDGRVYETGMIPAYGWKAITPFAAENSITVKDNTVQNDFFILSLDAAGRIDRLYDKRFDREVLKTDLCANEFQIFEDMPLEYENWELAEYYATKGITLDDPAKIEPLDEGDRKGFCVTRQYRNSTIRQYIYLYQSIERIDVHNELEWAERKQLVKIAFPFDVHTTKATYDIQFGSIERNTHFNTSWDAAKFEVCGQKWVDVSEYGYGVSLLNDCKYGHSAEGGTVKLTALKCGTDPNEQADQGHHEFWFSIYPHQGGYQRANTVRQAYSLNQPPVWKPLNGQNGTLPESFSLVRCDAENIVIDTVKGCEEDDTLIVRLYDSFGCRSQVTLEFGIAPEKAELCDLMENPIGEIPVQKNQLRLDVENFEIVTVKVKLKKE